MLRFTDKLAAGRVLIADGAMGTMLQKLGLAAGLAPERWNLENAAAVRDVHCEYIDAGADMILTNTFGGSAIRLRRDALQDRTREINCAAAGLAREAAGAEALVIGDIGPTGEMMAPLGSLTFEDAVSAFAEQAAALAEGGVDAILIETMSDLSEVEAAVTGVRQVTALPLLTTMSFDTRGRTMMGVKPEQAAVKLLAFGADIIGANCGRTLSETLTAIIKMREAAPDAILMAKPNAGLPHVDAGELVFDVSPDEMASYALQFIEKARVKIFGGCCGSTPAHIRAIANALKVAGF